MATILHDNMGTECSSALAQGDQLWLQPADFATVTGWSYNPEGFCRGDVCVPVPAQRLADFVSQEGVNVAAFWDKLGNAVVHDESREVWVLGANAAERSVALQSLAAPDFTLPDLDGHLHQLAAHRGKKVFLVTWASW
jgi:hypothetical protein